MSPHGASDARPYRLIPQETALAHKGPVLVEVVSARQELAMPPKTLNQAYSFGMFMMKAVLDGQASQLIDLAKLNDCEEEMRYVAVAIALKLRTPPLAGMSLSKSHD